MKRIILPTDFSPTSLSAIKYALELFREEECTFYLVNTYTPAVFQAEYVLHSPGQIGLGDTYQSESEEQLEALRKYLLQGHKNPLHTIINHSAYNMLVEEVVSMTEKEGADLIVMGTKGATGAKEVFLGTHTVHMIKKSECPVIAIPEDYKYKGVKSVLFATDYEVDFYETQLADFLDIVLEEHSHVHVLHIVSPHGLTEEQKENRSKLETILGDIPYTLHDEKDSQIIHGIHNFQKRHDTDMLVMIQNKHTFLERLFIEPVIQKIGYHISLPFMVVPSPLT